MKKLFIVSLVCLLSNGLLAQKYEGLALTPPMGWNSWNTFETNINEALIMQTADIMVSSGMKAAGYEYIILDDGWMAKERDSITGDLIPDPKKFPGGMDKLVAYVHSKGLKIGLYNCAGTKTCAGYPGSRGYEYQDARLYAKLQIDYLKYDWCNTQGITAKEAYATMSNALKMARRPIVFSLCEWGDNQSWEWATPIGHLWRTTGDIYPCFDCEFNHGTWSSWGVMRILDMRKNIRQYAGPGHWNDPDMMEVGNGMTTNEDRTHFAMWAMQAAPLIAGNDLSKMTKETLEILTNKEIIAIDQDALGIQGFKFSTTDSVDVWCKPLVNDDWAICFLNRSVLAKKFVFDWKGHLISDTLTKKVLDVNTNKYIVHPIKTGLKDSDTNKKLELNLQVHDVLMLRLQKK